MVLETKTAAARPMVGMGDIQLAHGEGDLVAVLGSCVGVCLFQKATKYGALAHVVLPKSGGRAAPPGKFADSAVPAMVEMIRRASGSAVGIVAKLAGGANMFSSAGPLQIGLENSRAIRTALQTAGIPLIAEHLGGNKGRRIRFNCLDGTVEITIVGTDSITI